MQMCNDLWPSKRSSTDSARHLWHKHSGNIVFIGMNIALVCCTGWCRSETVFRSGGWDYL